MDPRDVLRTPEDDISVFGAAGLAYPHKEIPLRWGGQRRGD